MFGSLRAASVETGPADGAVILAGQARLKEGRDLVKRFRGFRRRVVGEIVRVGLSFMDMHGRLHSGLAQLSVDTDRVAEQQVARSGGQDRWRKSVEVSIDGRQERIGEIVAVGVVPCGRVAESVP